MGGCGRGTTGRAESDQRSATTAGAARRGLTRPGFPIRPRAADGQAWRAERPRPRTGGASP
jgi:hypothetical protein